MQITNIEEMNAAVMEFVKGRSASDVKYAMLIMNAYLTGREAAEAIVAPAKKERGRPTGSRNRKALARGVADLPTSSAAETA